MIFSRFKWNDSSILELRKPKNAFIYYRTTRLNLLTGFPETYSLDLFLKRLELIKVQNKVDMINALRSTEQNKLDSLDSRNLFQENNTNGIYFNLILKLIIFINRCLLGRFSLFRK